MKWGNAHNFPHIYRLRAFSFTKPLPGQVSGAFWLVGCILTMVSNESAGVDKLITFGQMALEQDWYDQELDYRPPYLDDEPVRLALAVDL